MYIPTTNGHKKLFKQISHSYSPNMMTRLIEMRMFLKQVVDKVDFWVLHFVHCHLRRLQRILVTVLLHFLHDICPGIKLTRWRNFTCCFDDRNFRARSPAVTLWLPKNETFLGGITALVSEVSEINSMYVRISFG